jgi:TonB family protein
MKYGISLLLFAVTFVVPAVRSQTPDYAPPWNMYTIKGEHVSIALPALPAIQTSKETRTRPQKDRQRHVIKLSVKGIVYTIHLVENNKPRLSLETFIQEQSTANPFGDLTWERNLTLDGVAGKSFIYPDGKGRVQFFAEENRLYEVRASGASVDDPKIATFFRYFSLKKQRGAIQVSEEVQAGNFDPTTGRIITSKEADTKVILISKPEPTYTEKAKSRQITGTVVLRCVFASDGTVTNIRVIQGLPNGLTEKAIEAARKITFKPATKDGVNVSMWMQLEYNFNLFDP